MRSSHAFPFAADVVFFEDDLFWSNKPVHNGERPLKVLSELYPSCRSQAYDIAPGFAIEDGKVVADIRRQPLSAAELRATRATDIARANQYGRVTDEALEQVLALLRENLSLCLPYLKACPRGYRFLIALRNSERGIAIEKQGQTIRIQEASASVEAIPQYDIVLRVRLSYVKWALSRPYGDEVLFVGSGGTFEYRRASDAAVNLHRELVFLLKRHDILPKRDDLSTPLTRIRQTVKALLGRQPGEDLYDLDSWTVYQQH